MINSQLEALRWKKFPVLDDGFVCLVDAMGDDQAVVQAARVCYGQGTKSVSDDRGLIRYLMRHQHTTPFEMAELKFLIRMPMDAWRQHIRHRTASVNEYSTRYSEAIDSAQKTPVDCWRRQASSNRQGSGGYLDWDAGFELTADESDLQSHARRVYEKRLECGVAREQARKDLPLATYTQAYWKIDLHNLLHYLGLRMEEHAQWEIRQYSNVLGEIVKELFPITWEAFLDYRLEAVSLSRLDLNMIQRLSRETELPVGSYFFYSHCEPTWPTTGPCRERDECLAKLKRMGLIYEDPGG